VRLQGQARALGCAFFLLVNGEFIYPYFHVRNKLDGVLFVVLPLTILSDWKVGSPIF